jgi:DNA-binding response OmpR family regulator
MQMAKLRKKLGIGAGAASLIETVRGAGYRFEG